MNTQIEKLLNQRIRKRKEITDTMKKHTWTKSEKALLDSFLKDMDFVISELKSC